MRDRADEALPCNRPLTLRPFGRLRDHPSTLRRAQGPQGQGPPFDPSTLRQAQGPQAQGTPFDPSTSSGTALRPFDRLRDRRGRGAPLTVWLIKKADIVRKRHFHKDKSLFLCQCQLLVVPLYPILDWRVVVLSSELLDSVLERPTSSTLLLYTFVIPA